jgi:TetR/AcrR family transcriptional repressor of nem operon
MIPDTKDRILEAARLTVQNLGYNGLSFRELAKEVGIKSASIHYYFATKGELGAALARSYNANNAEYLESLSAQDLDLKTTMARYTDIFGNTLRNENRMCLAGILSAERNDIPEEVRAEVVKFGDINEQWIAGVLTRLTATNLKPARLRARAIFAAVSGAQLIAHSRGSVTVYDEIIASYRTANLIP